MEKLLAKVFSEYSTDLQATFGVTADLMSGHSADKQIPDAADKGYYHEHSGNLKKGVEQGNACRT